MNGSPTPVPVQEGRGALVHENNEQRSAAVKEHLRYEVALYSDVMVQGEARGVGPYDLLNAVSTQTPEYAIDVAIFARVSLHGEQWYRGDESRQVGEAVSRYHGGSHDEELAAILSLALGIRLKSGAPTRMFFPSDPLGRPQSDQRRPIAYLRPRLGQPILALPRQDPKLESSARALRAFMHAKPAFSVAFAKAARQYQEGIWVAESDPERAWLSLINAIETAAVHEQHGDDEPAIVLRRVRKPLAKLLEHDETLLKKVAKELSRTFKATDRFVTFLLKFCPGPPPKRPPVGAGQIEWTREGLTDVFSTLYDARSRVLHDGTGFPSPMCTPPLKVDGWDAGEERPCALGYSHLGTRWLPEEVPSTLASFHYIVQAALMNWLFGTPGPV